MCRRMSQAVGSDCARRSAYRSESPGAVCPVIIRGKCPSHYVRAIAGLIVLTLSTAQDLKKHRFYYWFAFPTIARQVATIDNIQAASEYFKQAELTHIASAYFGEKSAEHRSFFILQTGPDGGFVHRRLNTLIDAQHTDANFAADGSTDGLYFCFSDPSVVAANAGWPARMFVAMLLTLW